MKGKFNVAKKMLAVLFITALIMSCNKKNKTTTNTNELDKFYVLSYEPSGTLPNEIKKPSIYVQFSEPVVPLSKLGEPSDKSDIISIEPALNGVFRWYGTSLLSFECTDEVIPQMEYIVKINSSAKSINGNMLTGMNSFSFKTEELKMVSVVPGYGALKKLLDENPNALTPYIDQDDVPLAAAGDIGIFFNYPVDLDVIKNSIEVKDENGKTYNPSFSKIKDENAILLKIKDKMPENKRIDVTLKNGAQAQKGYLKTEQDQTNGFHTILPFSLLNTDTRAASYGKFSNPVYFYFSHHLDNNISDFLVKNIKTNPAMEITKDNINITGRCLMVYGLPVTYEDTYSMSIPSGISDIYGRKTTESLTVQVEVPAAAKLAFFKDYGSGILEAQFTPKLAFQFQNIIPGSFYEINAKNGKQKEEQFVKIYNESDIPKNMCFTETVDLEQFLIKNNGLSVGNIFFEARMQVENDWYDDVYIQRNEQTIQVTDLGVTVRYGYNKAIVVVSSLKTGEPIANADVGAFAAPFSNEKKFFYNLLNNVSLFKKEFKGGTYIELGKAITDKNGLAVINFKKNSFGDALKDYSRNFYIEVVNQNDRIVFNPDITSMWRYNTSSIESPQDAERESMRVFMFTDRKLYKPGEKITFRGIDRTQKLGNLDAYKGEYSIEIKEDAWKGETIKTFQGKTTSSGGFFHKFNLASDLKPGDYVIKYSRKLSDGNVATKNEYFQVAFFERLRFQASASIPNIIYTRGDRIDASVSAEYLGGGSLAGCVFESSWFCEPCGFSLSDAKFDGYTFGPLHGYDSRSYLGSDKGTLSVAGKGSTSITSGGESLKGMAYQYRSEIRVTDQSNQMIAASAATVVHPALYYIGLSSPTNIKGFAKKGDKLDFKYQAVMPDGTDLKDDALPKNKNKRSINVELLREEWKLVQQMGVYGTVNTRYVRNMVSEQTTTVALDKSGSFSITAKKGGSYLLRMSCTDKNGNDVVTERRFYVIGSDWYWHGNQSEELTLTCNKNSYAIGETAQIMLQSPLEKGHYLLTIEREGVFHQEILDISESVTVLDIPVKAEYLPIAYVTLSTYSTRTGEPSQDFDTPDINKPKGYFGLAPIYVNKDSVTFDISVKGDKSSYRPGETAKFKLKATQNGTPLAGVELSLLAVDRGVIDLINYHIPNPVEFFYNEYYFPICTKGGDSRSLLIDPVVYAPKNMFGGDADSDDSDKMNERKNFDPTAVFEPYLVTGEDGTVECTFVWPDNLTAYRVTAVGVNGNHFAISENEVNVSNPISARDVVPSTIRLNDISEAGLVISNLQDSSQSLEIEAVIFDGIEKSGKPIEVDGIERVVGHATLIKETKKTVSIPANSTNIVMFPLKAEAAGFVTVQFTVRSKILNEKILKPIEIERPYVFETVTTTGSTGKEKNASAKELLIIPSDSDNNQGNISITLDATRLGVLKEAVDFVFRYPYDCLEQRSSAIMPMIYFADYIKVFGLESEVKKPRKVVESELRKWKNYQLSDGGFPYWPSGSTSAFAVSVRIGEIIAAAKDKNYDVLINEQMLKSYISAEYSKLYQEKRMSLYMRAYVNYVLTLLGQPVSETTIDSIVQDENATISELCYAGLMYVKRNQMNKAKNVMKKVSGFMRPTTRGIDITSKGGWSYWQFFGGEIETYALALKLYSAVDPENSNVGHLVYQLLQFQRAHKGYWKSTATTARVLDAFATYIEANDLKDTNFTAEALIDGKKFVNGKFKGVGADPVEKTVALTDDFVKTMKKNEELPIEFSKNGTGDLFYTVSMKYAISADKQMPRDEGLGVYCEFIDIVTGKIVTQDKLVAGKTYKARVIVSTTKARTFVALRVPIPAGAEVQNAAFVTTGSFQEYEQKQADDELWWDDSYNGLSNETIYENEVQYFWNYMGRGRQEVDFLFRAVRSGTYHTPAVTAECMYEPEIFGRSSGKIWIIE